MTAIESREGVMPTNPLTWWTTDARATARHREAVEDSHALRQELERESRRIAREDAVNRQVLGMVARLRGSFGPRASGR